MKSQEEITIDAAGQSLNVLREHIATALHPELTISMARSAANIACREIMAMLDKPMGLQILASLVNAHCDMIGQGRVCIDPNNFVEFQAFLSEPMK